METKQKEITRIQIDMSLIPSELVNGPNVNKLDPYSFKTSGSGSALQIQTKRSTRTVRIEVNSMDRDLSKYPYPNQFQWEFPFPVKEIREVRLVGGTIPVPFLSIDVGWNKFTFVENSVRYLITIPIGFYTVSTLISRLQTQLNGIGGTNTYVVTQNTSSGQIVITGTGGNSFSFLFGTGLYTDVLDITTRSILSMNCPAHILGFDHGDYTSISGVVTAPYLPNIWYALEKSYLYLNFNSSQDLRSVFRGNGRKEPSAILYNDELNIYNYPGGLSTVPPIPLTKYLNKETYDTVIVPAPAPISRISYLEISLRNIFYTLIDTQGRELSLLLELVIAD